MDEIQYEAVIGLEVHAELETQSKMFCGCPVVDSTAAGPNIAVCPICAGMPGMLPVVNRRAVEYALRVALALECEIAPTSIFARKNYFYPDLPKGYQISQYEQPLAVNGRLEILTSEGRRTIRIRRVHMEEDTGKLTHVTVPPENGGQAESYSLVDLNRAGVPLLEIVSEPDLHTAEEVRAYASALRSLLRYLRVNSGDMQKGVMRIEPNVSVRPKGSQMFGTRTEIKNLNSFRALERSVAYEIERQIAVVRQGGRVTQETLGWDEHRNETVSQRSKEDAHDYRYFPEPDLPPLVVDQDWVNAIRDALPELPAARYERFLHQYGLSEYDAGVLVAEPAVAEFFETAVRASERANPKIVANWISGELFGLLNQAGAAIEDSLVTPQSLADLIELIVAGKINQSTGKAVLTEMFETGQQAAEIVNQRGLQQISEPSQIEAIVIQVLNQNTHQVREYLHGKENLSRWLFGQVMRAAGGQANPRLVQAELDRQLAALKDMPG
jgi:aspartyl-tRNA(Asn)/glutamyl-tRNA(Gln) amidotransferase subunit B